MTLPRPLTVIREAEIENRRSLHDKIYQEYRAEKCNDKGEQENNLTWEEKKGLKSLMQRVSKGEILVMKTDKSGNMSVTTRDKYLEMGKEHVGDDEEVGRVKIVETDKILNEHSAAWCSIWSTGRDHEHQDRVLHSKTSRSENRANLYLTHKDHKKENDKTRPVGTANSSNTRAFANSVSDLLESVAASGDDKFEVISSEDLLHHTKESNRQVKENKALVAEKKQKKDNCWNCKVWKRMCRDCKEQKMRRGRTREEENKETAAENLMRWLLDEVEDIIDGRTDCKECEKEKRKIRERECRKCGDGVSEEENQYALVGMDAVALFPSLSGKTTASIVRKRVFESEVSWEGFNWRKAAIYILANKHLVGKIGRETRKFLPLRKKNQGVTPGMGSKGLSIKEKSEDEQWFYPRKDPGKQVIKEMVSMVAQIGVRVLWETYCYDFGGKTFLQKEGGPIGQRPTMAASRIVMEEFFLEYRRVLVEAGVKVMLMKVYVDDGRQLTTMLRKGMRYDRELNEYRWDMTAEEEDRMLEMQGESKDSFMARLCLPLMNSINDDLTFTAEVASDFADGRLPTLDFSLWQREEGELTHSYFEKSMKSQVMLEKESAMSVKQKITIQSNELTRRL